MNFYTPFVEGVLFSLFLVVAVGHLFFYMLALAIEKGVWHAISYVLGIVVSDMVLVTFAYFGLNTFVDRVKIWWGIRDSTIQFLYNLFASFGILIILIFGLRFLLRPYNPKSKDIDVSNKGYIGHWLKGFFMNMSNPFAILIWINILQIVSVRHPGYTGTHYFQFFTAFFLSFTTIEFTKVFFAHKLSEFLTGSLQLKLNRFIGVIFVFVSICFGFKFFMS